MHPMPKSVPLWASPDRRTTRPNGGSQVWFSAVRVRAACLVLLWARVCCARVLGCARACCAPALGCVTVPWCACTRLLVWQSSRPLPPFLLLPPCHGCRRRCCHCRFGPIPTSDLNATTASTGCRAAVRGGLAGLDDFIIRTLRANIRHPASVGCRAAVQIGRAHV